MKRHEFEAIAAALREARRYVDRAANRVSFIHGCDAAAVEVANALAQGTAPGGNRAFDRELFLRNAGVQS